ncbi:lysophospholipase [Nocardia sp. NBC_01499]|uniref:alpha/beta hydrolase n=1 Tax=Nocardia sp. NBC_01499 TaxID=2903597 RepID=UPI0038635DAE
MPDGATGAVPAMLLVAGSGPTDRDGDSAVVDGSVGTLRYLADVLARHGFASLRYDKLSTGKTGMGPFPDMSNLSYDEIVDDAAAALNFLAAQQGIDHSKIGVIGHSQGALVALALADHRADPIPGLSALGLIEPQTDRTMDLMTRQITGQVDTAEQAGKLSRADGDSIRRGLSAATDQVRAVGTIPDDLPQPLRDAGLVAANSKPLATQDQLDPIAMASNLPAALNVLTSCADKDIQIRCVDVARLDDALKHTRLRSVHLTQADHVLKDIGDQPSTGAEYGKPLPFSQQFTDALGSWLHDLQ